MPTITGGNFFHKNLDDFHELKNRLIPSIKIRSSAHDAQLKELLDIKRQKERRTYELFNSNLRKSDNQKLAPLT